jgi:ABC-type transport system, involved in lipoprotein release, permease component
VNKTLAWMSWKFLFSRKALFGGSAPLALLGLIFGVALLVVSMAVMSGFERTLRDAMADVTGHAQVVKRSRFLDDPVELEERIKKVEPTLLGAVKYTFIEAVVARQGQISGILIQGIDRDRMDDVLNFSSRVDSGKVDISVQDENKPGAMIGKGLAKRMNLQVGDVFNVVIPIAESSDPSSFQRRVGQFRVTAILDLGKFEWNERFVVTDLKAAQDFAKIGEGYTGLLLKFKDIEHARDAAYHISQVLGSPYWVRDWRDSNESLFQAVEIERPVIFFVVSIIVIVAALNISSTLFVNVVQRYNDISILKTVGFTPRQILQLFSAQGVMIGALGLLGGFILGFILCALFAWLQQSLNLVAGSVYKIEGIHLQIRFIDSVAICVATLVICFLATLMPARRGSKLSPVEGLRYG